MQLYVLDTNNCLLVLLHLIYYLKIQASPLVGHRFSNSLFLVCFGHFKFLPFPSVIVDAAITIKNLSSHNMICKNASEAWHTLQVGNDYTLQYSTDPAE